MAVSGDASVDPKWKRFAKVMRQLFQLDKRELDFGIYRVMNLKRREIEGYLEGGLQKEAQDILEKQAGGKRASLEEQLQEARDQARALGVNPDSTDKVQKITGALSSLTDMHTLTERLWGHLATFFARYWDEGDFVTKRRYMKDTYAIPYEGQETLLYWANCDQYYIKTTEVFTDWAFKIADGKSVRFVLREPEGDEALTEQNNDKIQGKTRLFALQEGAAIEVEGDVMTVPFVYRLFDKEVRQSQLVKEAAESIKQAVESRYIDFVGLLSLCPVDSNPKRTLAQKQLESYTARNTADYFIHKDLHGFLRRELDWYVKNEVLFIEDIDAQTKLSIEDSLALSNAFKAVGGKIIDFLAGLEDFQKRLWLKRKFVVRSDWCVTLDRVPHELYGEVASNERQRQEWVRLFAIDKIAGDLTHTGYSEPLSVAFLEQNPQLIVDSALFGEGFKRRLLEGMEDIDGGTGGTLVKSDNFHALMLLRERYAGRVKCIYIDPPYNTGGDGFVYKDSYQHSTWLTMMENRLRLARDLLADDGAIFISIDDNEQARLKTLCDAIFGEENFVACICHKARASVSNDKIISENHNYLLFYAKNIDVVFENRDSIGEKPNLDGFNLSDENGEYKLAPVDGPGGARKGNPYYEFLGVKGYWRYSKETMQEKYDKGLIVRTANGLQQKYYKSKAATKRRTITTWWDEDFLTSTATSELISVMGDKVFNNPKNVRFIMRCIEMMTATSSGSLVLDFFGGSGTTAHAVINLNREDGGARKWVVVEAAPYFEAVTKSRIMKAMYSDSWSGGIPARTGGVSGCFKVLSLEQYEDTLDNLYFGEKEFDLDNGKTAGDRLKGDERQNYTAHNMIGAETRDYLSYKSLLDHPFAASMKIRQGAASEITRVDVVETFNYLLGLVVRRVTFPREDLELVEGQVREERVLVVWRDAHSVADEELVDYFRRDFGAKALREFKRIYVNGDSALGGLLGKSGGDRVRLTQQAFARLMFG